MFDAFTDDPAIFVFQALAGFAIVLLIALLVIIPTILFQSFQQYERDMASCMKAGNEAYVCRALIAD